MAHLPRTFARVTGFEVSCPHCGTLSILATAGRWRARQHDTGWNPRTGVWRCRRCKRSYSVGVVLWKKSAGSHGERQAPGDRVPTPAESLGLRGIVTGEPIGTGMRARGNLVSDGEVEDDPPIPPRKIGRDEVWEGIRDEPREDDPEVSND